MTDIDTAVEHIQKSYATAVWERDVRRFIGLYDERVHVFDAWGVWQYEGAQQWQRAVEGWFSSLGTERVRVAFEDTRSVGTTALAFASATVTYAGVSAEGKDLRAMQNRISWGLRSTGHVLRIVHEHTSAPVGFEDMKAIVHREASQ
jgi:ketosteroid isomerase-like protein